MTIRKPLLLRNVVRCEAGSSLVEFTLVFPMVLMVLLGTIDMTYMLFEWNQASKATYIGARKAIVSQPAAPALLADPVYDPAWMGDPCFDGAGNPFSPPRCPSFDITCTSATCDNAAFDAIVTAMGQQFPRLIKDWPQNRDKVVVRYQTNGLGFVGRPGGPIVNVTVSLQCLSHQIYFLGAWAGWLFPQPSGCQPARSMVIPTFASTLTGEDLDSTLD